MKSYPLYKPGSCSYVDEAFDCQNNGKPDTEYLKWRWKPDKFDLPSGLPDKSKMFDVHGYEITKGRGFFVFKFQDYNCTIEFVWSHFLVKEGVRVNAQGNSNPTLSINHIDKTARRWQGADILVFNTGHWWAHGKTSRGRTNLDLILVNVGFNYPIFLTFINYVCSWLIMALLKSLSILSLSPPPKSTKCSSLLSLGIVMSLSTGLANYRILSDAKIALTPAIVLAEFVLFRKRISTRKV
ncbi:hypothetical protein OROGR_016966 [Orobanche gracilis]